MSELEVKRTGEVVRTVDVIAAEINELSVRNFLNILAIGRRMVEAKDLLPHGQFGPWLEANTIYSTRTANNYMRLFEEYGEPQKSLFGPELNSQTFANLDYSKAYALLKVPKEEREEFVKTNDVESMSTRELQKAIKERDEARQERDEAMRAHKGTVVMMGEVQDKLAETQNELTVLQDKLKGVREARDEIAGFLRARTEEVEELKAEVKQLQERPVEVAVQEPDQKAIDAAVEEALAMVAEQHRADMQGMQEKLDKEVAENNKLEKRLDKLKTKAAAAESGEEKAKLQAEVERLSKKLKMANPELTAFQVRLEAWVKARDEMLRIAAASDHGEGMRKAIQAQIKQWVGA